jgi:hypothetical protein
MAEGGNVYCDFSGMEELDKHGNNIFDRDRTQE